MLPIIRQPLMLLALAAAAALCTAPATAAKPEWAGNPHGEQGKGKGDEGHKDKGGKGSKGAAPVTIGGYFGEHHRTEVRTYYQTEYPHGKGCPPGLAKKNNGCMPPGQARKWAVGQPLPRDVVYYPVPSSLVVRLGPPPPGYEYVRVAADVLLIAAGTRMVIDGMQDLVR